MIRTMQRLLCTTGAGLLVLATGCDPDASIAVGVPERSAPADVTGTRCTNPNSRTAADVKALNLVLITATLPSLA